MSSAFFLLCPECIYVWRAYGDIVERGKACGPGFEATACLHLLVGEGHRHGIAVVLTILRDLHRPVSCRCFLLALLPLLPQWRAHGCNWFTLNQHSALHERGVLSGCRWERPCSPAALWPFSAAVLLGHVEYLWRVHAPL